MPKKIKLTSYQREQIRVLRVGGVTQKEIAVKLDLRIGKVQGVLASYGMTTPRRRSRECAELDVEVRKQMEKGLSFGSIKRELNIGDSVLSQSKTRIAKANAGASAAAADGLDTQVCLPIVCEEESTEVQAINLSLVEPSAGTKPVIQERPPVSGRVESRGGTLALPNGMAKMYLEQLYSGVDYLCDSDVDPEKKVEILYGIVRLCLARLLDFESNKEAAVLVRSNASKDPTLSLVMDDASHHRALLANQILKVKKDFADSVYVLHVVIHYCIEKTWGEYRNG